MIAAVDGEKIVPITYLGSSNMGERSWGCDFELGFIIVTDDRGIQETLRKEMQQVTTNHTIKEIEQTSADKILMTRFLVSIFGRYL